MCIETKLITKTYINGDSITKVLKDVSVHIAPGDFVAITGPSGSGKSTLMNIIGCLDRPSAGIYYLAGQNTARLTDRQLAGIRNKYIGFVFQSFNLLPQYTALENVQLSLLYASVSRDQARVKAQQALEDLGLGDRLHYKPHQLSGGQKQRVAIARAIANSPALILADEPTGSLDTATGQEVLEIFRELNNQGNTIIMVTHDLDIAQEAARIINIRDGQIQEVG